MNRRLAQRSSLYLALLLAAATFGCSSREGAPGAPGRDVAGQGFPGDTHEQLAADLLATARELDAVLQAMEPALDHADATIGQGVLIGDEHASVWRANEARLRPLVARVNTLAARSGALGAPTHEQAEALASRFRAELDRIMGGFDPGAHSTGGAGIALDTIAAMGTLRGVNRALWTPLEGAPAETVADASEQPDEQPAGPGGRAGPGAAAAKPRPGGTPAGESYDGPHSVSPSGIAVDGDTPLEDGMLVLVESSGSWYAADVLDVLPGGDVEIHYRGWTSAWDQVVPRERLQLVPGTELPEAAQDGSGEDGEQEERPPRIVTDRPVPGRPELSGPASVSPSGIAVDGVAALEPGMVVLVEWAGQWFAADVLAVRPGGDVEIHYRGWDASFDEAVPLDRIQRIEE